MQKAQCTSCRKYTKKALSRHIISNCCKPRIKSNLKKDSIITYQYNSGIRQLVYIIHITLGIKLFIKIYSTFLEFYHF